MRAVRFLFLLAGHLATSHAIPTSDLPLSEPKQAERINSPLASWWTPPMKSNIQFILTGIPDVDENFIMPNTGIYELDMYYTPNATMQKLSELGQKTVCYFSAATAENWRDDYSQFQQADLGRELPDWPGERYLDIRRDNVFKVISKRVDLAKSKGCDSIEPDNVDVYSNDNGFSPPITPGDSVKYLHKVSAYARSLGMSVGIKNCVEILGDIFDDVDFAISEQCVQYQNCTAYSNFTTAPAPGKVGKPVFEVEYVNYTYEGDWSDTGVALQPNLFQTSNVDFPTLRNEALRRKLCNLDLPGVTLDKPYLKINTIIKTLDLNGFIMFCDGNATITRTKDVGQRKPGSPGIISTARRTWARELMWRKMAGLVAI